MHWDELRAILDNPRVGAEVGVRAGNVTGRLLKWFPELHMYAVDRWKPQPDSDGETYTQANWDFDKIKRQFYGMVRPFTDRCTVMEMDSLEAAGRVPDASLDFVFIDAQHTYDCVKADILAWRPKLKPGGWLTGHDYQPKFPGVIKAVDELVPGSKLLKHSVWAYRV